MCVPQLRHILSPKPNDQHKSIKMGTCTPKHKLSKKNIKENAYHTAFVSNNQSYLNTPFEG